MSTKSSLSPDLSFTLSLCVPGLNFAVYPPKEFLGFCYQIQRLAHFNARGAKACRVAPPPFCLLTKHFETISSSGSVFHYWRKKALSLALCLVCVQSNAALVWGCAR